MDKISLKLLRKLYKYSVLDRDTINHITMFTLGKNHANPHERELFKNDFVKPIVIGQDSDGFPICDGSLQITLPGRSYIENLRKENFDRRYPKIISTIALIVSIPAFILAVTALLLALQ